jgi:hypothetical protein
MNIVEAVQIDETHFQTLQPVTQNYTEILFKIYNNKNKFQNNSYDNSYIDLVCGKYKNDISSSDEFAASKKNEILIEDSKWKKN